MKCNDFRLGGRYKHKYKVNDEHLIILLEAFPNKDINKNNFIEIDIKNKELIDSIENTKENDLLVIAGHIESEICEVSDHFNYINKLLVADKIVTNGN